MKAKKRINFRLNGDLYQLIQDESDFKGVPKSEVLKQAIEAVGKSLNLHTYENNLPKTQTFNAFLDVNTLTDLNKIRHHFNLNQSEALTHIIYTTLKPKDPVNLHETNTIDTSTIISDIRQTWLTGELRQLNHIDEATFRILPTHSKATYVASMYESGNLKKTLELIELFEDSSTGSDFEMMYENALACILKARVYMTLHHFPKVAPLLEFAHEVANSLNNRFLIGYVHFLKGMYAAYMGQAEVSRYHIEESLSLLDPISSPVLYGHVYVRHIHVLEKHEEFVLAKRFLQKLETIVKKTNNKILRSQMLYESAVLEFLQGNTIDAITTSQKGIISAKQSGSTLYEFYGKQIHAIAKFINNPHSIYEIEQARDMETDLWPEKVISYLDLFKTMHLSRYDFEKASNSIEYNRYTSGQINVKPDYVNYLLNSTEYIYSNDEQTKRDAEIRLRRQAVEGQYSIARKAAKQTLETKRLVASR